MAEFPALPLWTDAYLSDTRHLSTEEHGAYLLLLMEAWRRPNCSLPDDDRILSRLCGLPSERWAEIKPVIFDLWHFDGRTKTWTQKRLTKERDYVAQKSKSQRDKVAKRWDKTKNSDTAVLPTGYRNDTPTPTPTPKGKEEPNGSSKKQVRGTRLPPEWALPKAWGDWAVHEGMTPAAVRSEADRFRDYWIAQPGQKGVKTDWVATWRNWIRKRLEQSAPKMRTQVETDFWTGPLLT